MGIKPTTMTNLKQSKTDEEWAELTTPDKTRQVGMITVMQLSLEEYNRLAEIERKYNELIEKLKQ
jgi:hypothetical protein